MKNQRKTGLLKLALIALSLFLINLGGRELYAQVSLTEQKWVIPTYKVAPAEKTPIFFRNETYQGASRYIYPYKLNDNITNERSDQPWKALILENEYVKLCVTPEIGGKIFYATDKTNGYNFIYKNDAVKPANIGMTGAWVSGGIEWCVLHHHRASSFLPVDYDLKENPDGSKTIIIGETEPRQRIRWTIAITMFPGKSYYQTEVKIYNDNPFTYSFLYWANVAVHTNKDYQVIFPPSVEFATMHAKTSFARWPVSHEVYAGKDFTKGVDISWWKNSPTSASFFAYDLKEDFMGGYDHGKNTGTVHIGDHNVVKGAKLWEWGSSERGQATEAKLNEHAGPYAEIMVGAFSDNQPDYSWIKPFEVKTFKQYWYPVKDIEGFKNANLNGAVNLEQRENNTVFLAYNTTSEIGKAKVILRNKDKVVFEKIVGISPAEAFITNIKIEGQFRLTDLSTELTDAQTGEVLVSYTPIEKKITDSLPETVSRPPLPKDIQTVEELYVAGNRIELFHNPRLNPMDYYNEALARDPGDIRTNTAVGNIYLKEGDYENARKYLLKAIARLTKDYTRPVNCEPLYLEGMVLKAMGLYSEAEDTLYRATWDYAYHSAAYFELAGISCIRGNYQKALDQINESLSTNTKNNTAVWLKAAIQRKLGDYKGALVTLGELPSIDPLDFKIGNEYYLINKESGNTQAANTILADLNRKMRDYEENYLGTAVGYVNTGLLKEADEILKRFKGSYPIVDYYLGYIQDKSGNRDAAAGYFKSASGKSTDYVFPFRLETLKVLNTALKYNPADGKAFYYKGNILYDRQPAKAMECWEQAVKADQELSIAYRNLGWGYYQFKGDGIKAIEAYEKAVALNKDEPMYYNELDQLYEMSNASVEKRMKLFEGSNETVKKRDDSFLRQISILTLAGYPDRAVDYLTGRTFSYVEGSSNAMNIILNAHLLLGKKYLNEKKYTEALDQFMQAAQIPEEEAGNERSFNRSLQVNYYLGLTYEAMGQKKKAKEYYSLSAHQDIRGSSYLSWYAGMSNLKLGKKEEASKIFKSLVDNGNKQIETKATETDVFAKFGTEEAINSRISEGYLMRALGYKGSAQNDLATADLKKSVELSAANLWASSFLKD
jgi:tetratricopeptide (TPR) repeat protein